jgi:hypothetical protein
MQSFKFFTFATSSNGSDSLLHLLCKVVIVVVLVAVVVVAVALLDDVVIVDVVAVRVIVVSGHGSSAGPPICTT